MKQKKIAIFFVFAFVSLVGAIKALEVVVGATGLPVGESRDETTKEMGRGFGLHRQSVTFA